MSTIKESKEKNIDYKQLDSLWKAIGWKPRGEKRWAEVLKNSSFVFSIWENNNLIGFGRIMGDGVMCMFYDIDVLPKYQRKGLGTRIKNRLIEQIKNKRYVSIGLFAWGGNSKNIPFYEKFGFKKVSTGMELEKYMKRE